MQLPEANRESEKTRKKRSRGMSRKYRFEVYFAEHNQKRIQVSDPTLKGWACEGSRASPR